MNIRTIYHNLERYIPPLDSKVVQKLIEVLPSDLWFQQHLDKQAIEAKKFESFMHSLKPGDSFYFGNDGSYGKVEKNENN